MTEQVAWGSIILMLDNEAFRRGFLEARRWYFQDIYGEDGRPPEEPERAITLNSEEVLRLIVISDEQGYYHLDPMGNEHLPEYLGNLVGYLSGPLAEKEAAPSQHQPAQLEQLCNSVTF